MTNIHLPWKPTDVETFQILSRTKNGRVTRHVTSEEEQPVDRNVMLSVPVPQFTVIIYPTSCRVTGPAS
jgi:hypothetical protein